MIAGWYRADHRGVETGRQSADDGIGQRIDVHTGRAHDSRSGQAETIKAGQMNIGIHGLDRMGENARVNRAAKAGKIRGIGDIPIHPIHRDGTGKLVAHPL